MDSVLEPWVDGYCDARIGAALEQVADTTPNSLQGVQGARGGNYFLKGGTPFTPLFGFRKDRLRGVAHRDSLCSSLMEMSSQTDAHLIHTCR